MNTAGNADYADLLSQLDHDEPHTGWLAVSQVRRLTDDELAVVVSAHPEVHEDAICEMQIKSADVARCLEGNSAYRLGELLGEAYRLSLVRFCRQRVFADLQTINHPEELA